MIEYHNPKGIPRPFASDRHDLCAIYLARYQEGIESCRRFMQSLARTNSREFGLFIVYKGFPDVETMMEWHRECAHPDVTSTMMPDHGYDLTAYRIAAEMVGVPSLVFFNSHTEILDHDWVGHYRFALQQPGVGLVGATGSWESFQYGWLRRLLFPAWPNPHIRTNAFAMRRDLFLRVWPRRFRTKQGCYLFESGHNSLTRRVWAHGLQTVVMDSSGALYKWWDWRVCGQFRGDQGWLVASDCKTRDYDAAVDKSELQKITWG